jgi:hypothetical protein
VYSTAYSFKSFIGTPGHLRGMFYRADQNAMLNQSVRKKALNLIMSSRAGRCHVDTSFVTWPNFSLIK